VIVANNRNTLLWLAEDQMAFLPEEVDQLREQWAAERRRNKEVPKHRAIVEAGGGIYVRGMMGPLVLFNSPKTGSTLALPENELTPEAVALKLLVSNKAFGF
jgi:hypothetical protein